MAMTYLPKIDPVKDGRCNQTIRVAGKRTVSRGDVITFHGWEGRAYRSKWSWRKEVIVINVIPCEINEQGILIDEVVHAWTSWYPDKLAEYDYIDPPNGVELRDVLFKLNGGPPTEPINCIIIRW